MSTAVSYRALVKTRPAAASLIAVIWLVAIAVPLGHNIPIPSHTLGRFGLVVGIGLAFAAAMEGAERLRNASSTVSPYQDFASTWMIAAALLLPPAPAALAIAVIHIATYRTWRAVVMWRPALTGATAIVAGYAAAYARNELPGTYVSLIAAVLVFVLVQAGLVYLSLCLLGEGQDARCAFSSGQNWFINLSTSAAGAALVDGVSRTNWWAITIVVAAMVVLQRVIQRIQLTSDEVTDAGTGVLTEQPWSRLAEQLMMTTHRWTVVLLEPLDPTRLSTVAATAQLVCRDGEEVGRLDTKIALLVKGPRVIARNLALRIQADLDALGIDCLTGAGNGDTLHEQLDSASTELLFCLASR